MLKDIVLPNISMLTSLLGWSVICIFGRGGGLVVNVHAFYSNDPSSILAEVESEETKRNEILVDSYLTNNNKSKCNVQ